MKDILYRLTIIILSCISLLAPSYYLIQEYKIAHALETPHIYLGAFVNNDLSDLSQIQTFEQNAGKDVSIIHWFSPWGGGDGSQNFQATWMDNIRNSGSIPMITWEPFDPNLPNDYDQPNYQLQDILNGNYDTYIDTYAAAAAAWGHPFFMRFAHEMNGDWYAWAEVKNDGTPVNGNAEGEYIQVWQYVHDRFEAAGATNATWVWCPNRNFFNSPPLSRFYPGDSYVDWLCVDGYNRGGSNWRGFEETFQDTYKDILEINEEKPIMLGEIGTVEEGGSKADWLTDALSSQLPLNYPNIQAFVYFNADRNGNDNRIETSSSSIQAFANAVNSDYYASDYYDFIATSPIPPPSSPASTTSTYAEDHFERTETDSWGNAETGGTYTLNGNTADYDINDQGGLMDVTSISPNFKYAILPGVSAQDVEISTRVKTDKPSVGSSQYAILIGRRQGNDDQYRGRLRIDTGGNLYLQTFYKTTTSGGEQAIGSEVQLTDISYTQGEYTKIKMQLEGTNPTSIRMKAWKASETEPSSWQYTATDSEATLQAAGGVGLHSRLNFGTSNEPVLFSYDDFLATSIPPEPTATPTPFPSSTPTVPTPTTTSIPVPTLTQPPAVPTVAPTNKPVPAPKEAPKPDICNDQRPSVAPQLFQLSMENNQATVYFTPAGRPYSYYYIAYGETSNAEAHGTHFQDDRDGVISHTIHELEPGRTYYFKVRAGNGCMPGDWSEIRSGVTSNASTFRTYETINNRQVAVEISQVPVPTRPVEETETHVPSDTAADTKADTETIYPSNRTDVPETEEVQNETLDELSHFDNAPKWWRRLVNYTTGILF